ncbi:MAG TPA: cytochrome D1 domain-containing protein [Burkholderiales bacterium]|jgi:YVTN family beta-propeller protein|nr:cytochrome D1 domain-containing protein [Burkholderiales bacterium]
MTIVTAKRPWSPGALLALACLACMPALAADGGRGMAYVSNQNGDVTVIDLDTLETVTEFKVGAEGPRGIGVTADGKLLVTANGEAGDISVIDRASGRLLKRIPIGKNPEFVRIRGNYAFVSFEPAAVGGPPPKPGSEEARALAEAREEEDAEPAKIAVVDLKKGKVIRAITGGMETEGIEFSADGKLIIVTNEADENLSVHEIATGRLVKKISTKEYGNRPRGIKMIPDGSGYVASLEFSNKLVVLDKDFDVVKVVPTGEVPYGLAFDRSGERLFVALAKGKALQVFDAKTFEPIRNVPTGDRCWHFTFTPDDSHILVACGRSNEVVVIDAKTLEPVKRIADKKMPWGIVTYPKAIGSLDVP